MQCSQGETEYLYQDKKKKGKKTSKHRLTWIDYCSMYWFHCVNPLQCHTLNINVSSHPSWWSWKIQKKSYWNHTIIIDKKNKKLFDCGARLTTNFNNYGLHCLFIEYTLINFCRYKCVVTVCKGS